MKLNLKSTGALLLALFIASPAAMAATYQEGLISSFPNSGTTFTPSALMQERLQRARQASMIVINGRTSTKQNSAADELLALKRALSARKYIIENYSVSPLKILVNFVSASDFITENDTQKGQLENQRVEIILHFLHPEAQASLEALRQNKRDWKPSKSKAPAAGTTTSPATQTNLNDLF